MKKQSGFTLIELVIVIVILGILAATAVPKFVNLQGDARAAAITAVKGALEGAASITYAKAAIAGDDKNPSKDITIDGETVAIVYGYPAATKAALEAVTELSTEEWTIDDSITSGAAITAAGSTSAASSTCKVIYVEATSTARPTITVDKSAC